jgi:hypothetical protein
MSRLFKKVATEPCRFRLASTLLAGAALAMAPGCSSPCDNVLISAQPSPDGLVKAVVFTRSCGATTPFVTEVSVLPASAGVPSGWPNALSVRDDPDHPMERNIPAIDVRLRWISGHRLSVSFPRAAMADKRATNVRGVVIDYSTF